MIIGNKEGLNKIVFFFENFSVLSCFQFNSNLSHK